MKFRFVAFLALIFLSGVILKTPAQTPTPTPTPVPGQVDTAIGQITNSTQESFAGGISTDGRFVVIESRGNIATENPRNADGNREIFLFDYAQRRIYQITDTKSSLTDTTIAPTVNSNIKVEVANLHPSISGDGRWIAFESNATTSVSTTLPNGTSPKSFDGNAPGFAAILQADGNTEIWLYQVPATGGADLTSGAEIAPTDLSTGTFTEVTNTAASARPTAGSNTATPFIAEDNHDPSINADGNVTAFASTRNLKNTAGTIYGDGNDEIFTYIRSAAAFGQVTATPRNTVTKPIYNDNPTISANGARVMFASTGNNPVVDSSGGSNADFNEEVFYANLDAAGNPLGTAAARAKQVSVTTQTNAGDVVNIISLGARMSKDGRYIGFDSFADLTAENGGTNYTTSFGLFVYDTTTSTFRRIGPRSNADAGANGGDVPHYPGFTLDDNAQPVIVYQSRLNIKNDGTIPATAADGLNPDPVRPVQIFSYPLSVPAAAATFSGLTTFPTPNFSVTSVQPILSGSVRRITFNYAFSEIGTGNPELLSETYYLLTPVENTQSNAAPSYFTGASRLPVSATVVATPTPGTTPTPSPSPTPVTPSAVQGLAPAMLAIVSFPAAINSSVSSTTAVGSINRRFTLPIELNGVSVTVQGIAAGIKSVSSNEISFVIPPAFGAADAPTATTYPVVINFNGTFVRTTVTLVPVRPDVFTKLPAPGPGGRALAVNATNRVKTSEPFTVTTQKLRGGVRVATVLRVFMTGVREGVPIGAITARIGSVSLVSTKNPVQTEPGVYAVDFLLTNELRGAGDKPVVVSVTINGIVYFARLDDTAPRISIL